MSEAGLKLPALGGAERNGAETLAARSDKGRVTQGFLHEGKDSSVDLAINRLVEEDH